MIKKKYYFKFHNTIGGFNLTINNPIVGKQIADIIKTEFELEQPIDKLEIIDKPIPMKYKKKDNGIQLKLL